MSSFKFIFGSGENKSLNFSKISVGKFDIFLSIKAFLSKIAERKIPG